MSQTSLIYLDYAATTPVAKEVADKMVQYLTFDGIFGNPASRSHGFGWQAEEAVETAVTKSPKLSALTLVKSSSPAVRPSRITLP